MRDKRKLIIVEGMDNTGKSTLIHNLTNFIVDKLHSDFSVGQQFHSEHGINHYERLFDIIRAANTPGTLVLCDRIGIVGEEVYGKELRGKSIFKESLEDLFSGLIRAVNCDVTFIYCIPSRHEFDDRIQMEGVMEHAETLKAAYSKVIGRVLEIIWREAQSCGHNCQFLCYDYQSDPNYLELFGKLET